MAEFLTDVDIANRALQHCGAELIDATLGFSEISKRAEQTEFTYPKVREAELRANVWTFSTRRQILRSIDTTTMLVVPALWTSTTTYFVGSIVADANGNFWICRTRNNLNNEPQDSLTWEPYFGPMTVSLYDTDEVYHAGELVYTTPGDGTARVYLSLQSDNDDNPATATAYDATSVYMKNQVVTYLSVAYMSLIDLNTANTPSSSPAIWNSGTTYSAGQSVGGSDGVIYTSVGNGNLGNDPTLTVGLWTNTGVLNKWTTVFVGGTGSVKWLLIGGTEFPSGVGIEPLNITYPLGAGPSSQQSSANIFRLPNGFLRIAPQNPKATPVPWLGGPAGTMYNDWLFENGYLISSEVGPIRLRFVASVTDVTKMDAMFCESLAARLALEVCEPLTQSGAKLATIAKVYQEWTDKAVVANAIEQGWEDPPDDTYVSCRL